VHRRAVESNPGEEFCSGCDGTQNEKLQGPFNKGMTQTTSYGANIVNGGRELYQFPGWWKWLATGRPPYEMEKSRRFKLIGKNPVNRDKPKGFFNYCAVVCCRMPK